MNRRYGWLAAGLAVAVGVGGLPVFSAERHGQSRPVAGASSGNHTGHGHSSPHAGQQHRRPPSLLDALRSLGRGVTREHVTPVPSEAPMDDWSHLSHPPRSGHMNVLPAASAENGRGSAEDASGSADRSPRARPAGLPRPIDQRELDALEKRVVRAVSPPEERGDSDTATSTSSRRQTAAGQNDAENSPAEPSADAGPAAPRAVSVEPVVPRVARRPLPSSAEETDLPPSADAADGRDAADTPTSSRRRRSATRRPSLASEPARGTIASPADGARPIPSIGAQTAGSGADEDDFEARRSARRSTLTSDAPASAVPTAPASPSPADSFSSTTSETPAVRVTTEGPRRIPLNQPVEYEIKVANRGAVEAPGVLVRASLPAWSVVRSQQSSRGDVKVQPSEQMSQILWQIEGLPAGGSERLVLRLAAQRAEPFDMQVQWALLPQTNVATVHVQQPKLQLLIEGPDSVVYGSSQVYKVRVLNPGSGPATDVSFTLSPNSATPQTQHLGEIPAGKEAQFEVELTAQDRGRLEIHGLVTGGSGLRSESLKQIEVASADLVATLDGPQLKYQNSQGLYHLVVTNDGLAESRGVTASIALPQGVQYVDGIADAEVTEEQVRWKIERLAPGQSLEYDVRCEMQSPGTHRLAFQCQGSAAGAATVSIATEVEALEDLKLAVSDPGAPAPVGDEVVYEIRIHNRGSKAATDVKVIAQFSQGIEPVRIEEHRGELVPGQVLFEPVSRIDAGQEIRLRVFAKADSAGVHRFRTEVSSGDCLLVAEEATRYITFSQQRISRRSGESADAVR